MAQVIERIQEIAHPGTYEFELHDLTPRMVVRRMFERVNRELPVQVVCFKPACKRDGIIDLSTINVWPTDFLRSDTPHHPRSEVLNIRGLLSELVFEEKNSSISSDPTWRSWTVNAKDLGSLELDGDQLHFTHPYSDRDGVLQISLRGFLPKLDGYENDPTTFDPTEVWINLSGTPGPLVSSMLRYLNEIAPAYVSPFWYNR